MSSDELDPNAINAAVKDMRDYANMWLDRMESKVK